MSHSFDVAVIGAGPAGAATARRLAEAGCRVVLLERSSFDQPRVGESLAPAVQPLLVNMGVWDQFLALQPLPSYGTRSVWGEPRAAVTSHLLTPYLNGWHVDRLAFDRMLAVSAEQAGARLRMAARVLQFDAGPRGGGELLVGSSDRSRLPERLRVDFVVDASGRRAMLSRWVGARHAIFDRLVGVAAQFDDPDAASHCYTLVETTPDGWWYSAPMSRTRSVAMLMTDGDLARRGRMSTLPCWQIALRRAGLTAKRVESGTMCFGPAIFSAISQRLVREAGHPTRGWLAVGDAALAVDPISGSGVLRALRSAADAAGTALASLSGDADAVDAYEKRVDDECRRYLAEWAAYYAAEPRWSCTEFWGRRAGAALAAA
jgi:flavin-dependent dehydrogenase